MILLVRVRSIVFLIMFFTFFFFVVCFCCSFDASVLFRKSIARTLSVGIFIGCNVFGLYTVIVRTRAGVCFFIGVFLCERVAFCA